MNTNKNTGAFIRDIRLSKGMTLEQVGNAVGVAKSTVKKWEDGTIGTMRKDKLFKLAHALNVPPSELLGLAAPVKGDNVYMISKEEKPVYSSTSDGGLQPVTLQAGNPMGIDFCVVVKDDSLSDIGVSKNDVVMVHNVAAVPDGKIAAVLVGGSVILRRSYFDLDSGVLQLIPANPAYKPLLYTGDSLKDITVLGVAVCVQHNLA